MAFGRKDYTGPVKDRGTVNRGGKKLANVSKEELDAFRKKKGNEGLSYKESLRALLNKDRGLTSRDGSTDTGNSIINDEKRRRAAAQKAATVGADGSAGVEEAAVAGPTAPRSRDDVVRETGDKMRRIIADKVSKERRDTLPMDAAMKHGGKVKKMAAGGAVKGYGAARGSKACKIR